jgi:biopolymer transport protein ExbD
MKLGVYFIDLFANTLFVFMLLTILAFSSFSESPERTLPPVTLAQAEAEKTGTTAVKPLTLSAQRGEKATVKYFLNDQEVAWADLASRLAAAGASAVVLRVEGELPTQVTIRLLALLHRLKITDVAFAFKADNP